MFSLLLIISRVISCLEVLLVLFPHHGGAALVQRTYTKVTGSSYGSDRLGSVGSGLSLSECGLYCWSRYPNECETIIYNSATGLCTAGSALKSGAAGAAVAPNSAEGELFALFACDASNGFQYVSSGSESACIMASNFTLNFYDAVQYCLNMDASLFVAPVFEKLQLLPHGHRYTIGLTDITTENTFVWQDTGEAINSKYRLQFFAPGDPNNADGQEHCTAFEAGAGASGVDYTCSLSMFRFVCERPLV
ncbi:hypothetical protein RRG08_021306 [Elysia crispata]|uniref:C-type lectin domain-containing protein n=1 Tax=Elysia crispata TaxID=231223 RepID=A0AAE0ZBY3_9GAST|nr:hypothetical protein RRG08_021306 [Elysia crispata]